MVNAITAIVICIILILAFPLVLYSIGLLLPSTHIVSRTHKYHTTPEHLWAMLTNVSEYPSWRSNIEKVTLQSNNDNNRITFTEYSKKDRRTVVIHIEQEHERKLLQVLEERPNSTPTRESTFSGSWTFTIDSVDQEGVSLSITEQGVINKPMVRVSHMFFFGYHRRIDRFMKDLGKEISEVQKHAAEEEKRLDESIYEPSSITADSKIFEKEWEMINGYVKP